MIQEQCPTAVFCRQKEFFVGEGDCRDLEFKSSREQSQKNHLTQSQLCYFVSIVPQGCPSPDIRLHLAAVGH